MSEASCTCSSSARPGVSENLFKEVTVIGLFSSLKVKAGITPVAITEKACLPAFPVSKTSLAASETTESAFKAIRSEPTEAAV